LIELLKNIPGKQYIIFFPLLVFVLIFSLFIINRILFRLKTSKISFPDIDKINYIELAYAKKGKQYAVQAIIINLLNKNLLKINMNTNKVEKNITNSITDSKLTGREKRIYNYFSKGYILDKHVINSITNNYRNYFNTINKKLENLKLVQKSQIKSALFISVIILIFGISKLILGITNNKPSLFLFIEIILLLVLNFKFFTIKSNYRKKSFVKYIYNKYIYLKNCKNIEYELKNKNINSGFIYVLFGIPLSINSNYILKNKIFGTVNLSDAIIMKKNISNDSINNTLDSEGINNSSCGGCGGCGDCGDD
jgi:hypothetical protein